MNTTNPSSQQGIIALMTVLIIGALALAAGISMLTRSLSNTQLSLDKEQSLRAHLLATTCAEHALLELVDNDQYGGNETLLIDGYTCTINAIMAPTISTREIQTWSTVGDYTRRILVIVDDVTASPINIGSWTEVHEF